MQPIKLLNFYKLLSNVATNLVGAFIPLIVLQATGSVTLAALLYCSMFLIRILCCVAFKKQYEKYPQIVLMIRVVTVILYSFSIILIDSNLWLGVIGATIFYGIDMSIKTVPREILFNYASAEESSGEKSSLGFSRLMEQFGTLLAIVVGGVMLDFNKTLIVLISVVLYMISVVPLVMYYIKCKNQKTFNKDSVSNAQLRYEKNPELGKTAAKISKKVLISYAVVYFIYCFQDVLGNAFNIHMFLRTNSFGATGYLNAVYNAIYGVGCYIFSAVDSKKETTPLIAFSCIGCALSVLGLVIFDSMVIWYICMSAAGLLYGFICTYMLQRLLPKSRIMGVANNALFYRENASNLSVMVSMLLGCTGGMIPVLISVVATMAISAVIIPVNEEHTRKDLINYLQNHERAMSIQKKNSMLVKDCDQNPIIDATGAKPKAKRVRTTTKKGQ